MKCKEENEIMNNKILIFAIAISLLMVSAVIAQENVSGTNITVNSTIPVENLTDNATNITDNMTNTNVTIDPSVNDSLKEIDDDLNKNVTGFDIFKEKLAFWLTLNQEKKAQRELKLARLELIRARNFAKNNNSIAMEQALEQHDILIQKIQARIDSINSRSSAEAIKDSFTKLVGLERAIEVHQAKIERVNELLSSDLNLSEEQIQKIQARLSKSQNNTAHLIEIEEQKKDKIRTKLMAVAGINETEADSEIKNLENAQNLTEVKKMVALVRVNNLERQLSNIKDKLSESKEKGKNVTKIEERIAELENKTLQAKTFIASGNYTAALDELKDFQANQNQIAKEARDKIKENIKEVHEQKKEDRVEAREEKKGSKQVKE